MSFSLILISHFIVLNEGPPSSNLSERELRKPLSNFCGEVTTTAEAEAMRMSILRSSVLSAIHHLGFDRSGNTLPSKLSLASDRDREAG